jgi:hypothetical protein
MLFLLRGCCQDSGDATLWINVQTDIAEEKAVARLCLTVLSKHLW